MYYALETVHQLLVRRVVTLAVMIEVMAFWRTGKAVIALLVAAVIFEPTIVGGQGR